MNLVEIPLDLSGMEKNSRDPEILQEVVAARNTAHEMIKEERPMDALERIVSALHSLREFSDYGNREFRAALSALLFDLAEIHFQMKDYKQSEKEIEMLFKILEGLIKEDSERFASLHIHAMEMSTRLLRSRKKAMDMLVKQQQNAGMLYEKVNSGVAAATDRLVESLCNVASLLASSGDYRGAMKFYAEAIKLSKKRAGKVTRKEIRMTIDMARIMMRVRPMRHRAKRLLGAILPHAIALETIELEEEILALIEIIDADIEHEPVWKAFMQKVTLTANKLRRRKTPENVNDSKH